ncbi:9392_t:CDS:2 [Gigaspora margarita]|uniref:9392_t:CDS:1 n=1 Tax=Gigaspora margarita TaxID=4874 RepID=A0ABM8VWH8_GIGMA|nr:9392_t:CDS:2 [Gigaspora margarita]
MSIIALMPATEAYEVLLRNWGGAEAVTCCVWEEDVHRNFITFIPPNLPDPILTIIIVSILELLKQRITELEAKNDKLEAENDAGQ